MIPIKHKKSMKIEAFIFPILIMSYTQVKAENGSVEINQLKPVYKYSTHTH